MPPVILDSHSRAIDYLRVSVTDRCNLRCVYCTPPGEVSHFKIGEILSYEEILRVVCACVFLGVRKVRITGGEPLVRRGICDLIACLNAMPGIEDLGLTTNGVLLESKARPLYEAGLRRINVSLDSLQPDRYRQITGKDHLAEVLLGLKAAQEAGFKPIKINVVVMRGINDSELERLAWLTFKEPYLIRFIEYMPIGPSNGWSPEKLVSCQEIKKRLESFAHLHPVVGSDKNGNCQRFRLSAAKGEIGFISPITRHFCDTCNRLRLTPDGQLRPCLFSDNEVDLRAALRGDCTQQQLAELVKEAIALKPRMHPYPNQESLHGTKSMYSIGG
jgi:cyclic pyranopterin phosphate synthase